MTPQELLDAPVGALLGDDLVSEVNRADGSPWTVREVLIYLHRHAKRADTISGQTLAAVPSMAAEATRAADNAGANAALSAQIVELLRNTGVGMTPAQMAEAVLAALTQVAPMLRVAIAR